MAVVVNVAAASEVRRRLEYPFSQTHAVIAMAAVRDVDAYFGHKTQEELSNASLYVPSLHSMHSSTILLDGMWPCPQVNFRLYACAPARRAMSVDVEEEALSVASNGARTRSMYVM